MRPPRLLNRFLAETILFGGLPVTRADAARILAEDGHSEREIDVFAFAAKAVALEPLSYEAFRRQEAEACGVMPPRRKWRGFPIIADGSSRTQDGRCFARRSCPGRVSTRSHRTSIA
jgi:hypothetical protein